MQSLHIRSVVVVIVLFDAALALAQHEGGLWIRDPRLKSAAGLAARKSFDAGDIDECLRWLGDLRSNDPTLPPPALLLAEIQFSYGRIAATQQMLEMATEQSPAYPELFLVWGQFELAQRRWTNAQLHFEKALQLKPAADWQEQLNSQLQFACHNGLAEIYEHRSQWSEVVGALESASELAPLPPAVADRLAKALVLSGNVDGALEDLQVLKQRDKTRRPVELAVAAIYGEVGQVENADKWYEISLQKYPDEPRVSLEYAASLLVAGKLDESQSQLDDAIKKGTKATAEIATLRGLLAMAKRDYASAEEQFTRLLEDRPGDFDALRRLSIALAEQKDADKLMRAEQLAMIQAKKTPQSPEAQAALAWVLLRNGKPDEARQTLAKSPRGADPETLYLMARALVELGEIDAAKPAVVALRTQLKRPGWFPQRADAEEWLKAIALSFE